MSLDLKAVEALIGRKAGAVEAAARPAAQAGAQVLYDDVKANVARLGRKSGNLDKSIYQVFIPEQSSAGAALYGVSWNHRTAPHGRLLEFGHVQRYVVYLASNGKFYTAKRGKGKKPGRRSSQATKDAYYVPLPGGPRQVAATPFMRPARDQMPNARAAAVRVLLQAAQTGQAPEVRA